MHCPQAPSTHGEPPHEKPHSPQLFGSVCKSAAQLAPPAASHGAHSCTQCWGFQPLEQRAHAHEACGGSSPQ